MSNLINLTLIVLHLYTKIANCEEYEDIPDESNTSSSVGSESNEVYNASSKERPSRQKHEEIRSEFVDENTTINVDTKRETTTELTMAKNANETHSCKKKKYTEYPYSVSIQKKGSHYASGALVHRKWILSVASEFYNIRESIKLLRARLGSVSCKKGGILVPLKGIEIHPFFIPKKPSFDLALLRIAHPIEFSEHIKPISLTEVQGKIVSAKFLATYWPRLIVNGKMLANHAKERLKKNSMRVSTQRMIPWGKCDEILRENNLTLEISSLCLEPIVSHHSPCLPDAGAPITADDGLWGITSGWVSEKCNTYTSPTIFTRISVEPVYPWLNSFLDNVRHY